MTILKRKNSASKSVPIRTSKHHLISKKSNSKHSTKAQKKKAKVPREHFTTYNLNLETKKYRVFKDDLIFNNFKFDQTHEATEDNDVDSRWSLINTNIENLTLSLSYTAFDYYSAGK